MEGCAKHETKKEYRCDVISYSYSRQSKKDEWTLVWVTEPKSFWKSSIKDLQYYAEIEHGKDKKFKPLYAKNDSGAKVLMGVTCRYKHYFANSEFRYIKIDVIHREIHAELFITYGTLAVRAETCTTSEKEKSQHTY